MPVLTIDEISAKTLPALDALYNKGEDNKLANIISSTAGEPLQRLLLASIARQTFLGRTETFEALPKVAHLLEILIWNNILGNPTQQEINEIVEPVIVAGEASQKLMLSISIARFNVLK